MCRRGVRSPAFLGQFCPTISIKLSTAKVRPFLKCGGIRGHESLRAGTRQGIYPVSVVQAKIQVTGHQRRISSSSPMKSGVQRTHDERVPPRNSTVLSQIELVCVCVCVCVFFPFILDIKFVGRTSRGHTGGKSHRISHPPFCSACLKVFLARRIQPFLSLVDREVEFCVPTI